MGYLPFSLSFFSPLLFACHHVALRASSWMLARGTIQICTLLLIPAHNHRRTHPGSAKRLHLNAEMEKKKSSLIICRCLFFRGRCRFVCCIMADSEDKGEIEKLIWHIRLSSPFECRPPTQIFRPNPCGAFLVRCGIQLRLKSAALFFLP